MAKRTKAERRAAALKGWRTRRKNQRETKQKQPVKPAARGRGSAAPAPAKSNRGKNETPQRKATAVQRKSPARGRGKATSTPRRSPAQREAARRRTTEFKRRSEAAKKGWRTRKRKEAKGKAPAPKRKEKNQEYLVTVKVTSPRRKPRTFDLLVIGPKGLSEAHVRNLAIKQAPEKAAWLKNLSNQNRETMVAKGPPTNRQPGVRLR